MASSNYASIANQLAARKNADNDQAQSDLFRALLQQRNERGMQQVTGQQRMSQIDAEQAGKMAQLAEQEAMGQRETDRNLGLARELLKSDPGFNVNLTGGGGVALSKQRPEINPMAMLAYQTKRDNDLDRKVHQYSEDYRKTNIPQAAATLEDVNKRLPGGIAGDAPLKSVGGWKNLVPGFAVGALEGIGLLDKGAAAERASLQNLANTQVYDASGKAINESEMARLRDAMGWSPFTSDAVARDAIRRYGQTVVDKGTSVEAGTNPEAKAIAQQRGIPSVKGLKDIIGGRASEQDQAAALMKRLQELEAKRGNR